MSKELQRYLLTRFGQFLLIIFVAVSINFIIPRLLPGDPVQTALARLQTAGGAQNVDIQAVSASYRAKYGLDAPLIEQYFNYWMDLFRLDLGVSFANFPEKVSTMIGNALPWSVGLLATATLIAFLTGSLLGARLAWPGAGRGIKTLVPMMMVLTSIPFYLLAIILIYFFAVVLRWFPPAGGVDTTRIMRFDWETTRDILNHALLPALSIILGNIGFWALGMRSQMINVLGEDYITFAEAKGLPPRRIFVWYGMRNALLAQITALALSLGHVVSGAILVEVIFNYPGLGSLLYVAIRGQDYFVIQGVVLMLIVSLAVLLFIVDLIYPLLDPRIRR
ncbi:ABC transporter permease [Devosia rhodophyticola]|uniref:ABC transporter permease n=1 Tax=Devosia rhodophyticola TaxID=3026423 RepID=A0ABY7YZU1_9HYPH|nr:ABC transporter permease [Devosia rhodophyticola]WDR06851.1 ABC transporter permease [Devosia rhodophyticola]